MKKFLVTVLLGLLSAPLGAASVASTAAPAVAAPVVVHKVKMTHSSGESAIQKTFGEISDAWASGNAKEIASHFLKEGSLINPLGQEGWNRTEIEKVAAADLEMMKGSTQTFDDFKFHFVLPGFALVDATGTISGLKNADGTAASDMSVHIYATLAQRASKWYILSLRSYAFVKPDDTTQAPAPATAAAPPAVNPSTSVPTPALKAPALTKK